MLIEVYQVSDSENSKVKVHELAYLFYNGNRTSMINELDYSEVSGSAYSMFYNNTQIIDLSDFEMNTSAITDFINCFYNCSRVQKINVTNWDVSNCTSFSNCFANTFALTELDVSKWQPSSCSNYAYMFSNCAAATLDVSNWTWNPQANNYSYMFQNCKVKSMDFRGLQPSSNANMNGFCCRCPNLTKVWLPSTIVNLPCSSASYAPFFACPTTTILYTDAPSKPAGWSTYFNNYSSTGKLTVKYGMRYEDFLNA